MKYFNVLSLKCVWKVEMVWKSEQFCWKREEMLNKVEMCLLSIQQFVRENCQKQENSHRNNFSIWSNSSSENIKQIQNKSWLVFARHLPPEEDIYCICFWFYFIVVSGGAPQALDVQETPQKILEWRQDCSVSVVDIYYLNNDMK